jgi:hypothetical protein
MVVPSLMTDLSPSPSSRAINNNQREHQVRKRYKTEKAPLISQRGLCFRVGETPVSGNRLSVMAWCYSLMTGPFPPGVSSLTSVYGADLITILPLRQDAVASHYLSQRRRR